MTTVDNLHLELTNEFKFDKHISTPAELESMWYEYKSIFCTPATSPSSWISKAHREWERGDKTIVLVVPENQKHSKCYKTFVHGIAEARHVETQITYSHSKCVKTYIIIIFKAKPPPVKSHLINFNN